VLGEESVSLTKIPSAGHQDADWFGVDASLLRNQLQIPRQPEPQVDLIGGDAVAIYIGVFVGYDIRDLVLIIS
jgi:hypothetical protein